MVRRHACGKNRQGTEFPFAQEPAYAPADQTTERIEHGNQ
jgi:hypothetical protein